MPINVACNCGKKYRLKDELAGKKFKCKECDQILIARSSPSAPKKKTSRGPARPKPDASTPPSQESDAPQRRRKKKKRKVDPYGDDYRDSPPSALDSLGDDFGDEQNPYAAPRRNSSSRKKRGRSSAEALTATQKMFSSRAALDEWISGAIPFWPES